MATTTSEPTHPVSGAVAAMRKRLAELAGDRLWSMSAAEAAQTLEELHRLAGSVAELELRVVAHADTIEVGPDAGATSTASWWAHHTGQDRGDAARRMRLARALGDRERVRSALAAGDISEEAAGIIVRALDALPGDLDPVTRRRAEAVMVQHAAELAPRQLRIAGKALLTVVAPDVADAHEEKLLDAEEKRAREAMRLSMWDDGHGTTHGRFVIPTLQAAMLKKMLMAFAAPKHQRARAAQRAAEVPELPDAAETPEDAGAAADPEEQAARVAAWCKPTPQRLGEALCELVERFAGGELPQAGGMPATVVVTMTLDALLGGLGAAHLDTGDTISAGQARRLACRAGIIPMVLDGRSMPLDVGRRRRLHDRYQRLAIQHRDRTCTAIGCDTPAWLCHFHHDTPWSHGGGTSVQDGRLLCPRHHHHVHDPTYQTTRHPDGRIELHRRNLPRRRGAREADAGPPALPMAAYARSGVVV